MLGSLGMSSLLVISGDPSLKRQLMIDGIHGDGKGSRMRAVVL